MITALLFAVAVAGQVKDVPNAAQVKPAPAAAPAKAKVKAAPTSKAKADAQVKSVLAARKARRRAYNKRELIKAEEEQAEYQRQLIAQQKAIKEYQDYVIKMGPIWAAEHANQIQQQRNALIARQTDIMKQQADNTAWILRGLANSR